MALKEWKETTRDRLFLLLAFLLPALWLVVFGYGLNLDVENIPFAVLDRDRSELSRDYLHRFMQSRYFSFQGYADDERALDRLLTETKIRAAIIVPERFQEQLAAGESASVQTLLDGTFPLHTDIAKGYVIAINQAFTEERLIEYLRRTRGLTQEQADALVRPLTVEVRYLYNEEVRSTWSMVPALVMFTLMLASPLLTALGVVRDIGQLVEMVVDKPGIALAHVVAAGFAGAALFGTKIHVLSRDPGRDEERLRDVLARSGIAVEAVRTRMLSLEDVFVSRVMALEQAAQKEVSA
ncbi:MAG TPA: ABC transporter permease [Nitrospira sp.]|nr:ABC transporter permease [Nitrospira sp.]